MIVVVKDGLVGVVNIKGGVVIPCIYSHITPYTEGLCVVTLNSGNKQFFNNKGKPIGKEWEDLGRMLDGRAWVKVGDLYGYIDNKFTMVIDPVFEKVTDFYNNGARVRLPGRSSKTINRRGKEQDLCHKPKILGKERGAYNV